MGSLDSLCRFCTKELDRTKSQDLFDATNSRLLKTARICIPGTMSANDRYPKFACFLCVSKIYIAAEFCDMGLAAYGVFDRMMERQAAVLPGTDAEKRLPNMDSEIKLEYLAEETSLNDEHLAMEPNEYQLVEVKELDFSDIEMKEEETDTEEEMEHPPLKGTANRSVKDDSLRECPVGLKSRDTTPTTESYKNPGKEEPSSSDKRIDISESDEDGTTPGIKTQLIPETSQKRYETAYKNFKAWTEERGVMETSELVLLSYFGELGRTNKPSSLWTVYSMLRTTIKERENIELKKFTKLTPFLKTFGKGYQPKKAAVFTWSEITRFLDTAPDNTDLAMKVVAIMGVCGACSGPEILNMRVDHLTMLNEDSIMVQVPTSKTGFRRFVIQDPIMVALILKYWDLRPERTTTSRFFLNYKINACTKQVIGTQVIGKNKLSKMPSKIAKFLNLPYPEKYTGHSFRRTSATLMEDSGAEHLVLKRHGGWPSDSVAEGCVAESTS